MGNILKKSMLKSSVEPLKYNFISLIKFKVKQRILEKNILEKIKQKAFGKRLK